MYKKLEDIGLLCTGCGACVNICPANSIDYIDNAYLDGSLVAKINNDLCVHCGLCESVCPQLASSDTKNFLTPKCYAACAQDCIRSKSSSGGAFTVIAEYVLDNRGKICGAAYQKDFSVSHILISDKKDLDLLRRSKYVQSQVGLIYQDIKNELESRTLILFVGTPCQVAGLKTYLKKDYDNLISVDIYCNYAPSTILWKKYLSDNYNISQIAKIDFRVKNQGWVCDIHDITYTDGHVIEKRTYNDAFHQGYHSRLFMRKVCEECKFSGTPREGDFSIGDFWYINKFLPELDDNLGTSCVLVNNQKAEKVYQKIKNQFKRCVEVDFSYMQHNRGTVVNAHPGRDRFYNLLKNTNFNHSVDLALNDKYDVIIWGNWSEKNYGSELTYYALYKWLSSMGIRPLMVERPKEAAWGPNDTVVLFKESPYPKFTLSSLYPTKMAMSALNNKSNTFIVGSDQIWHSELYNSFGKVCFLDFISNTKKKIAYASSFGREYWTGSLAETQEVKIYLEDFDYISVREKSATKICNDVFNIEAQDVLDPVFMCEKKHYLELAQRSEMITPKKYIGAYILDVNDKKRELLEYASRKLGLKLNIITDAFVEQKNIGWISNIVANAYIEDWIKNIIDCEYLITDSFHGMCFAIIFRKPFIAIINSGRGAIRFTDFLDEIGLLNRAIDLDRSDKNYQDMFNDTINYEKVYAALEVKKIYSEQWLKKALNSPKQLNIGRYDILRALIQSEGLLIEKERNERLRDIKVHRDEINGQLLMINELQEQAKARLWDINVHRNEINWHLNMIEALNTQMKNVQMELSTFKDHLEYVPMLKDQIKKLNTQLDCLLRNINEANCLISNLDENIDKLNRNWCIRLSRKLSKTVKKLLGIGDKK